MIRMELLSGLVVMALWVFCLVEVIGTPEGEIRNLPKVGWLMIVLLFPLAGSIAWLAAGRPGGRRRLSAHERAQPEFPEYDRPGRAAAIEPEGDEEFLRKVRERAEEQRRVHREAKLEREEYRKDELRQRRKPEDPDAGA